MKNDNLKPINGIVVPLVTPLLAADKLDLKGLNNLIEHVIEGGVAGIFVLGTTGESQHLSYELRKEVIKKTCEKVNNRVPVLVGISDTSIRESIKLSDYAAECGATAVVATPPYYYTPGQAELVDYYTILADGINLPLYLYNMPSNVKINIEYDTVLELSKHPNIIGLKDSSANGVYFQKLLYAFKDKPFDLFVGPEEMTVETVILGGHGGVNGGANLFPELYSKLYKAAADKDFNTIAKLQPIVMEISTSIYTVGKHGSSYLKGLKSALSIKGLCSGHMSEPYNAFEEKEQQIITERIKSIESKMDF